MPAELHFVRPEWLWALPLVVLLAFALARAELAPGAWQRVVSPALAPYVLSRKAAGNLAYRWWLVALGGVIAIVALAGPAWDRVEQPVFRSEQALVIALDLSRSMDAQDVAPSRLSRARLKILDILDERQSGQTALVVFSSNAFTVTPLTTDTETIAALVNSLSTDIMPSRGSYLVSAINKGQQLLEQAGVGYGEVLLITDGSSTPEAEAAAQTLVEAGFRMSVLGVGTEDGAPIPRAGGGFVTDRSGNMAVPKLDMDSLSTLALAGAGRFAQMTNDGRDIDRLLSGEVAAAVSGTGPGQASDQWREEGPWLLLLLIPLASLAFRRGMVVALLLFVVMPITPSAHALEWNELWLNDDQRGQKKLAAGDAAAAATTFADQGWQAVANYRAGNFAESAAKFADSEDAASLYNLGNALARMGQFEPALDAYEQSLELRPDDEDTIYNRDLVAQMQQQQQQDGEQQEGDDQNSESGGDSEEGQGESDSEQQGEQGDSGDPSGESQSGDSQRSDEETNQEDLEAMQQELERAAAEAEEQEGQDDGEQEQMSDAEAMAMRRAQEQTQAMEQWLRRVENDPGRLLREKFRYQYQRHGRDQDGNSVWPDDDVEPW